MCTVIHKQRATPEEQQKYFPRLTELFENPYNFQGWQLPVYIVNTPKISQPQWVNSIYSRVAHMAQDKYGIPLHVTDTYISIYGLPRKVL